MNALPPGWYPDPWRPGHRRWWDGAAWTPQSVSVGPPPLDPRDALKTEITWARWARIAVWVRPLISVGLAVALAVVLPDLFDDFFDQLRAEDPPRASFGFSNTANLLNAVSLMAPAVTIALGLWMMHAATVGERLGRPARRSPGWALGSLFIPIVSLWFPYESLVDSLAADTPRRPVLVWWVADVLMVYGANVIWLLAIGGVPLAPLAAVGVVVALVIGRLGHTVVDLVLDDHRAAIAAL